MKKLIASVVLAAFATTAYGTYLGMTWGPGTTGDIIGDDYVVLEGSEYAAIEIWAYDLSSGLVFFGFGVNTVPPLGDPPAFTFEGGAISPGHAPYFYYLPGPEFPDQFMYGQMYWFHYYHYDALWVATLYFHCTGEPSIHTISTNDWGGDAFLSNPNTGDYVGVVFDASMTIEQVPEPAILSLLALGGLLVTRRRR